MSLIPMRFPVGQNQRVSDSPEFVERPYIQMVNDHMLYIYLNAEKIFAQNAVGTSACLESDVTNTSHHHIILFIEDGLLESA